MRCFVYLLLTFLILSSFAQDSRIFTNLSKSTGLSSSSITAIAQDHEGFIWIGTKSGVNRFDGKEYVHYHSGNSSLTSNDVNDLKVDEFGGIWVGLLAGGLAKYDRFSNDFIPINDSLIPLDVTVHMIYPDSTKLWVLSKQGIFTVSNSSQTAVSPYPGNREYTSMVSSNGYYWIGTYDGILAKADSSNILREFAISPTSNRTYNRVWCIYPISNEELLVGTQNTGLLRFNITSGKFSPTEVEVDIIRSIQVDKNGHTWIATDGKGIYEIDSEGKLHNYRHIYGNENSIASNAFTSIFEDLDGNLWFGTAWDGLSVINGQSENYKFYFNDFKGEKSTGVLSILSEENRLWLGSDGEGIHIYPPNHEWPQLRELLGVDTYPQFIKKMDDGYYWIGTFKKGLYRLHLEKRQIIQYNYQDENPSSINFNDIRDVVSLENNRYAVATWGGGINVLDLKTNQFSILDSNAGEQVPKNIVTLNKMVTGEIIVGTFGEGLFILKPDAARISPIHTGKFKNCISIYSDEKNIWIGTWGEGLFKMNNQFDSITAIVNSELVPNASALSILPDSKGGVYVGTKEGVFHIDENEDIQKINGLNGQYHINAAFKDEANRFYFGNTEGAVSFTSFTKKEDQTPDVRILDVKVFDKSLPKGILESGLKLDHDQNVLTFEYASLVYPNSSDMEYLVILEPLNTEWINMGTQRTITLANLNPRKYTLKLKTATSEKITSFAFEINNPWWTSWWAFLCYVVIFLLLLYLFRLYAIRLEKLKGRLSLEQLDREKEVEIGKIKQKFFINISHEIRTPLTLIVGEIERLISFSSSNHLISGSIKNIRSNSNYLLQLVNELLDYGKLESQGLKLHVAKGNMVKFGKEIFLAFQNLAESKDIHYSFASSSSQIEAWYDRDQMEKVLFNLLSNAFKYTASGGAIAFEILHDDQQVKLVVRDNGKGIPKEQIANVFKRFYQSDNAIQLSDSGFGIGLSIVEDIVKLHHGSVSVESELGKGTSIFISIPKGKEHFNADQLLRDFVDSESIQLYSSEIRNDTTETEGHTLDKEVLILIVEDNDNIRDFIGKVLQDEFRIVKAENGLRGLEMIDQELPDLIISDVMMPEMDGITFVQNIKSKISTSHIPVILLTARTGLIYKKEGYDTGADDFITKPFNSSMLKARVRNILHNRQLIHERIKNQYLTKTKDIDLLPPDEQFLINITNLVDKHLANSELDAGIISSELGMSHSVVYKKLKSLTGFSLVEFIRDYRLTQASKLLTSYNLSVAETCYKVGFSDRKYFSQMFSKKFKMTPSDYIRSKSNQ